MATDAELQESLKLSRHKRWEICHRPPPGLFKIILGLRQHLTGSYVTADKPMVLFLFISIRYYLTNKFTKSDSKCCSLSCVYRYFRVFCFCLFVVDFPSVVQVCRSFDVWRLWCRTYTDFLHLSLQKKRTYTVSTQQEWVMLFLQSEDFALTSLAADRISLKTMSSCSTTMQTPPLTWQLCEWWEEWRTCAGLNPATAGVCQVCLQEDRDGSNRLLINTDRLLFHESGTQLRNLLLWSVPGDPDSPDATTHLCTLDKLRWFVR